MKKTVSLNTKSDKKRYDAYFRKSKSGKPLSVFLKALWEYGIFVIPFFPAYLLFYCIVFGDDISGAEGSNTWLYAILLACILIAVIGGYFLRKLIRNSRFQKYSNASVPFFKGNRWICPFCRNENNLIAPCKACGIFPQLYKSENSSLEKPEKRRTRKEQREYDEYVPQFETTNK